MNKNVKPFFIIFALFIAKSCENTLQAETSVYDPIDQLNSQWTYFNRTDLISSIYKTANKYFCNVRQIKNPELIIYGTQSWTFPKQDINLTLSYPPADASNGPGRYGSQPYTITGFNVIVVVDNTRTKGYITGGGIWQENITLAFTSSDVTMLVYEFWLFGVRSDLADFRDVQQAWESDNMC